MHIFKIVIKKSKSVAYLVHFNMEVGRQENLFLYNKKKEEEKERLCIMCMNVCDLGVYSQPSDY